VSEGYKFEAPGCGVIFEAGRLAVTIRSSSVVAIGITPLESFTGLRPPSAESLYRCEKRPITFAPEDDMTMRVFSNGKNEGNVTDAIWLCCGNYQVVPLNPRLRGHIPELECAIQRGISARPDWQRQDFYILELRTGCAYFMCARM
jgi:hypothetical protein